MRYYIDKSTRTELPSTLILSCMRFPLRELVNAGPSCKNKSAVSVADCLSFCADSVQSVCIPH